MLGGLCTTRAWARNDASGNVIGRGPGSLHESRIVCLCHAATSGLGCLLFALLPIHERRSIFRHASCFLMRLTVICGVCCFLHISGLS